MRNRRLFFFLLFIALGIAAGIFYGWTVVPRQIKETSFNHLRSDYRTDFVLMVAEVYAIENDGARAAARLAPFQSAEPLRLVQEAILTAGQLGYASADVDLLANLARGLQSNQGGAP